MQPFSSKHALLANIIDYAGTFPPAALPFELAMKEAVTFRKELRHPWLVAKVAMTLSDLKKVRAKLLFESGGQGESLVFTALGSVIADDIDPATFVKTIEWDLREVRRFNERGFESSYRHWISSYETKLPIPLFEKASKLESYLLAALDRINSLAFFPIQPYFEVAVSQNLAHDLNLFGETVQTWLSDNPQTVIIPGIKIRTGGKLVPTADELALLISFTTSRGFRFKATQGLHHAISTPGEFGFINLFAALSFAQSLGTEKFSPKEIARILMERDPSAFRFEANKFSWGSFSLDIDAIEAGRRQHAGCFGSCSIKEPDESLHSLFP